MKRIAVFCGSSSGTDGAYLLAAEKMGRLLASEGIGLVYGGGGLGLMGKVAEAAMAGGGEVIGVIPKFLMEKELGDLVVKDLRVVGSMHERKAMMAELVDGFIAMPGGYGTLEELAEIVTWGQLGLHVKPFGLLNVAGFYDGLLEFLDSATHRGFIKPRHRELVLMDAEAGELLVKMREWKRPEPVPKWITPERT